MNVSIKLLLTAGLVIILGACAQKLPRPTIDTGSVQPGSQVSRQDVVMNLLGDGIKIGNPLPSTSLVDAATMDTVDLNDYKGTVLFLSIVPSIDTKVCEVQTHYLGEELDSMPPSVKRITISRDTPFAQKRFAEEAKLTNIQYLSDYKEGEFGKSTGLLVDGPRLLARSVVIVDKQGIVRYIQVVPDISHLPDMDKAFATAAELDAM